MMNGHHTDPVKALAKSWETDARWRGVKRPYAAEDVVRLRGSVQI